MRSCADSIVRGYIELAWALDRHIPGYVDSYYGPAEWREQAGARGIRPLTELAQDASHLAAAIAGSPGLEPQRRDFLARQVGAMRTSLAILQGEVLSLAQEAEALYDVAPAWVPEASFEEAHRRLDALLPPGGSLAARLAARRQAVAVPVDRARQLVPFVGAYLRGLTRQRFPLPVDESFEVSFVSNQLWSGYNRYLGGHRSRIDINTDFPLEVSDLTDLIAHEGYPGHHTELAIKEARLVEERGWAEHSINLMNAPSCAIAEGIASSALDVLMSEQEQIAWQAEELFPRAGFGHLDARREQAIEAARRRLQAVSGNAAFMLHDRGASRDEALAYLQRYGLLAEDKARKTVDFLSSPLYRSYTFNYHCGRELVSALLASKPDPDRWFTRLLSEPVTPGQIRSWIECPAGPDCPASCQTVLGPSQTPV